MSWNKTDRSFKILINRRVTDAEPSKYYYNEKGDFTLDLHSLEIKMDTIPGTPPGSDTSVVKVYNFAGRLTLIEDTSVPGQMTWFASSNSNTVLAQTDEASRLKDWIPDKYGSSYVIQLYDSADVQIPYSDASGWYFDYPTGILTFANANTDSGSVASRAPFKVVGYRYIGRKGAGSVSSARQSCRLATSGALPAHGAISSNVITASSNGALSVDGVATVLGDRILVKDEGGGSHLENGIYTVTQVGDGSHPYIITRATDADSSAEVVSGIFVFIEEGTANDNTGWMLTTNNPITLNTTALSFSQFTGAGSLVVGIGLNRSGATLAANINLDNSQASNQIRLQGGSGSNNSASAGNAGTSVTFDIKTTGSGNLLLEGKADGFELTGGATGRKLTLISGGLTLTSGNTNPNITIPNLASSTAVVNNGGAFTQYGVLFSSVATNGVVLSTGQGATGQPLVGQGASNPVFGNVDVGSYATGILGVTHGGTGTSTTFTTGSIVFAGGSGIYAQDNANLFWDDTNNTMGVGTTRSGAISGTNPSFRILGTGTTSSTSSFEIQDSGASTLLFVRNDGWVGIGTNSPTSHLHLLHTHASDASFTLHNDALTITSAETARDIKTLLVNMTINAGANTLTPSGSAYMPNQWNQLTIASGQSGAITIPLYGINNEIVFNATAGTTHTSISGVRNLWSVGSGAGGTITTSNAFMSRVITGTASTTTFTSLTHYNTGYTLSGSPVFTTLTGIDINDPGAGTVTTQYGVRIRDLSRGSTNYGIYFDGTSGLARQGVWWNADTNLYRSAAHVLTTDDNILLASVDKEVRLSSSNSNVGGIVWNTNWRLSTSTAVGFNFTQPASTAVGGSVYGMLMNKTLSAVANSSAILYGTQIDSIVTDVDAAGAIVYSGDANGILVTSQYQTFQTGGSLINLYGIQVISSFYDDLGGTGGTLAGQFGASISTDDSGSGSKITNSKVLYVLQNSPYTANSQSRYGVYVDSMPSPGAFTGTTTAAIYLAGTGGARDGIVFGSDTNIYRSSSNTLKTDDALVVALGLTVLANGAAITGAITGTTSISLGANGGTGGTVVLFGSGSGNITIATQAAAGTYNFNLPTTAGSSGDVLTSGGGGASAMTWTSPGALAVRWSSLTAPTGNLSLSMSTFLTTFNWATGTSTNNLFSLTTDASANGTGALLYVATGASATVLPLLVKAGATTALTVNASAGVLVNSLTSGRVTYAGTSGLLQDSANMTFDGSQLSLATTGSSGGIVFGGDSNLYRSAADTLKTDDSLIVATNLTVSTMTLGSVLYAGTAGIVSQDNANHFWDGTNHTLGIGTTRSGAISGTNPSVRILGTGASSATSSFEVQDSGATTILFVRNDGRIGIGTNAPSSDLSLGGAAARTIAMERASVNTGFSLTVQSGGAKSGQFDRNAGNLILTSGISTGGGVGNVDIRAAFGGAPGTNSDNTPVTALFVAADSVTMFSATNPGFNLAFGAVPSGGIAPYTYSFGVASTGGVVNADSLLITAGSMTAGTDFNGGTLLLKAGNSTGSGTSKIDFYTATAGGSGSTVRTSTLHMSLSGAGQLSLPVTGSTGGLLIGADTTLYRSAADVLKTDDSFIVGTNLSVLNAGTFSLYESGSVNFSSFAAGTQAADIRYTLPTVQPAVNQSLKATAVSGSGPYDVTLGWVTPSGGVDWTDVTGTSQTAAAGNGYLADNAGLVTFTLPTPAIGSIIEIVGVGAGGWTANCASGHTVRLGTIVSASTGSVSSTNRYDSIKLLGVSTTQWQIIHSVGTLDIV